MRRVFAAGALLALTVGALAQTAPVQPPPIVPRIWPELVKALQPDAPPEARSTARGPGQTLASVGREDLVVYDRPDFARRRVCTPLLQGGKPVEPLAHIAQAARDASITMIGEGHADPQTRHFIGLVAAALRKEGYAVYGAETFTPQIPYEGNAPPLARDGFYSQEPIYGRLVRQLRRDGYRLFPYEFLPLNDPQVPPSERSAQREAGQAANLIVQRGRENNAKILVHVGESHHSEHAPPGREKLMGQYFSEVSGVNPLTIQITSAESPNASFVVCDPETFTTRPAPFDIRIGLPKLVFERGRPRWRLEAGDRFAEIPASLRRAGQIAVYEARPRGERGDSTPMDRLLLRPGESLPLLLPPGRYDLSVWTEKDGWSAVQPLVVAAN